MTVVVGTVTLRIRSEDPIYYNNTRYSKLTGLGRFNNMTHIFMTRSMHAFVFALECVYLRSGDCQFYFNIVGTSFTYCVLSVPFCLDINL